MIKRVTCNQYNLKHAKRLLNDNELSYLKVSGDKQAGFIIEYEEFGEIKTHENDIKRFASVLIVQEFTRMFSEFRVDSICFVYSTDNNELEFNRVYLEASEDHKEHLINVLNESLQQASDIIQALDLEDFKLDKLYVRGGIRYTQATTEDVFKHLLSAISNKNK